MATSLAATIESTFNIKTRLNKGHDGIYEVSVDGKIAYSNKSQCGRAFPSNTQIIEQISKLTGMRVKQGEPDGSTRPVVQGCPQTGGCGCSDKKSVAGMGGV